MSHCKTLRGQITKIQRRLDSVSGKQLQHALPGELDDLLNIQKVRKRRSVQSSTIARETSIGKQRLQK